MKEKWADYEGAEAPELPEETLCRAEAVQRRARDTLKVQHWQPTAGLRETGHHLTIVLECFHLVSLLRILSKLMQENKFLQQNWLLSPASCKAEKEKYNSNCSIQQHRHRDVLVQKAFIFTICTSLISDGE